LPRRRSAASLPQPRKRSSLASGTHGATWRVKGLLWVPDIKGVVQALPSRPLHHFSQKIPVPYRRAACTALAPCAATLSTSAWYATSLNRSFRPCLAGGNPRPRRAVRGAQAGIIRAAPKPGDRSVRRHARCPGTPCSGFAHARRSGTSTVIRRHHTKLLGAPAMPAGEAGSRMAATKRITLELTEDQVEAPACHPATATRSPACCSRGGRSLLQGPAVDLHRPPLSRLPPSGRCRIEQGPGSARFSRPPAASRARVRRRPPARPAPRRRRRGVRATAVASSCTMRAHSASSTGLRSSSPRSVLAAGEWTADPCRRCAHPAVGGGWGTSDGAGGTPCERTTTKNWNRSPTAS